MCVIMELIFISVDLVIEILFVVFYVFNQVNGAIFVAKNFSSNPESEVVFIRNWRETIDFDD